MMMLITALQVAAPPLVAAPAPPPTPAQMTMPIVDATCHISDAEGHQHDLVIRQTGGRAFNVTRNGSTWTSRTMVKQEIRRDTAHIFDGFDFQIGPRATWPGEVRALKRPGQTIQVETFGAGIEGKYAILIRRKWSNPDVQMLGFCDVKKTPQAPLNAAETEEATRQ